MLILPESYPPVVLPDWAIVSPARRRHIERVTWLVDEWAREMKLASDTAQDWHDAARMHDTLRDAPEHVLRGIVDDESLAAALLHGPAAALLLERGGEMRSEVVEAVRHHTVGNARWGSTGRALYCADYLEPAREHNREDKNALAAAFPADPDLVFSEVLRRRIQFALSRGLAINPATVETWNRAL